MSVCLKYIILVISLFLIGCGTPNPPGRIWIDEINQNLAVVQWKEPEVSQNPIFGYEFQMKKDGAWFWDPSSFVHSPPAPIKNLESGTAYDFRVRTIDSENKTSFWKNGPGNLLTPFLITRPSSINIPSTDPRQEDFYFSDGLSTSKDVVLGDRLPIILIHGMSGEGRTATLNYWYWWLNDYFNNDKYEGMFKVYRYVYNSTDYIENNGKAFADFVNNYPELKDKRILLIGHSMGGLVSRCAMAMNPEFNDKVIRLITLGTPHLGSPGANPCWFYSCVEGKWTEWWSHFVFEIGFDSLSKGCFDLAWYKKQDVPYEATQYRDEILNTFPCREELLYTSMDNPFLGKGIMSDPLIDSKIIVFGGYLGESIQTGMGDDPSFKGTPMGAELFPSGLSNHIALFIARKEMCKIYKSDGSYFTKNDGLVPLESSLYQGHFSSPINITDSIGEYIDHASLLDNAAVMDFIMSYIWELIEKDQIGSF